MKFRSKITLSLVGLSALSTILAIGIDEIQTRKYLFRELQSKIMSISASVASQINGDMVEEIKIRGDEKKPEYQILQNNLRKARNSNRRGDSYVKFLYTIYPNPKNPDDFLFGVDPEEEEKNVSHAGTEDAGATNDRLYDHLYEAYSYGKLLQDPWGVWMTGYAPIYDSNGHYAATLGADVSADLVHKDLNQLIIFGLSSLLISLSLAAIVAKFHSQRLTSSLQTLLKGTEEIGKGDFTYRLNLKTNDEFGELAKALNKMNEGLEEKDRLKRGFVHYVSQHVLEKILKAKGVTKLEGEKRKITVFFSDIRNFTHIAELLTPEEVVVFLNDYFKTMIDIIFKHNGMLDKLIGDGIMAEFGAPLDDPFQERNAVLTAIEMHSALQDLDEKWKKEGKQPIEMGIGIHTGEAIMGDIGSERQMQYTAVGDTVNVAERLEEMTRDLKCPIIVSETTYKALNNEFPAQFLGPLKLHGKELPMNGYALLVS